MSYLVNMAINYENLGRKLRQLRKEQNITQEELAEKVGLDPRTVLEIEAGKRENPTVKTLNKIAEALGVKLSEILED